MYYIQINKFDVSVYNAKKVGFTWCIEKFYATFIIKYNYNFYNPCQRNSH